MGPRNISFSMGNSVYTYHNPFHVHAMCKNKMTSTHTLVGSHCSYKYLRVLCYLIALDLWMYFSYNSQCLRGFPV